MNVKLRQVPKKGLIVEQFQGKAPERIPTQTPGEYFFSTDWDAGVSLQSTLMYHESRLSRKHFSNQKNLKTRFRVNVKDFENRVL